MSQQPERIDPPDPINPDYDVRADVWSLGITLVRRAKLCTRVDNNSAVFIKHMFNCLVCVSIHNFRRFIYACM